MFTKCSFDVTENKLDYYRRRDCSKKLWEKLKDCALKIINYEKKEIIPLTDKKNKSYKKQEVCHIRKIFFCLDENDETVKTDENIKNYQKVKDNCHYYAGKFRGAAHDICNLRYNVPKNIPIIIHNAGYETHFIIDELAEKFKGELECIGKNIEKYINFSVPIKKCDDGKVY